MAITKSYGDLQKRYTPESLIENEFTKLSYIWQNCEKDKSWRGGTYEVPLLESGFSSIQFGGLAAANDIGEMAVAMGTQTMKELWGSILVRESDLYRHGDMEQSYLKIMPERIEEFVKFMQEQMSSTFLAGKRFAKATADGDASGNITVDKPHLFRVNQKIQVDDSNSSPVTGYVRSININSGVVLVYDARSGGSVVDLSGYTTAQNAIVQIVGSESEQFTSLKSYLLNATEDAVNGSNTAYGLTKSSYTTLQALTASGAAWTAETILDDVLTAFYTFSDKRGNQFKEIIVPYGMFKNIAKLVETGKRASITDKKAGYGFNAIDIIGAEGQAKIVALRDMPNDVVYFGDVSKIKFAGAEPFKRKVYNGEEFFMQRGTDGPSMISDMALRGDFIVKPSEWACVYSVAAAAVA